jgi:molybdopterin synthase sulfur carrier subunit
MVNVHFGQGLRELTGGEARLELEASTVRELIRVLDGRFPGIGERLENGTSVAINGDIVADAIYEPLPAGAEVHFLPTLSGG